MFNMSLLLTGDLTLNTARKTRIATEITRTRQLHSFPAKHQSQLLKKTKK